VLLLMRRFQPKYYTEMIRMSVFPDTSLTLIQKLAFEVTGIREAAWYRFFSLYQPAMRKFIEWHFDGHDPDDVVQTVFAKLAQKLQQGIYDPTKGSFRSFLSTMIRNEVYSLYRKAQVRGYGENVSLDEIEEDQIDPEMRGEYHCVDHALVCQAVQIDQIDLEWARACHESAVDHVLTKTAMSEKNKAIFREHVLLGRSATEVAKEFGVTKNLVGQIKFRVEHAIKQVELEIGNDRT